jgi:hypothetical protein
MRHPASCVRETTVPDAVAKQVRQLTEAGDLDRYADRKADEDQPYDMITAVNGIFAYLLAPEQRRSTQAEALTALKPWGSARLRSGELSLDPGALPPLKPIDTMIGATRVRLVREHRIARADRVSHDRYHLCDRAGRPSLSLLETRVHHHAILTEDECLAALEAAGFTSTECYRGFTARRPEPSDGSRLVLVGRRPLHPSA